MGWMVLWWALGLILLVVLVWAVARAARGGEGPTSAEGAPEQVLKRRYARGEIDRETYERMLEDLRR